MIRQIFFRFFWNTYDHLGPWVLISLAAALASLPLLTAPAAWGGVLACAARADQENGISPRDWLAGTLRHGMASTILGLAIGLGLVLCALNIFFYMSPRFLRELPSIARVALGGVFLWILVFGFIALNVAWAFLVLQDLPLRKALKRGLIVLIAHPISLLFTFAIAAFLVFAMGLTVVGLLFLPALLGNLVMGIAAGAVEYYEVKEDQALRARIEREGHRTWSELRELEEREAARFRRHDRGWRDIFKPWDLQ
ncbi:MAG TPA: hypothetical protein PLS90_15570 [Candidatus Sumerlaeota bacterium]|nr:hypothetical protein [Candidatus Sumerlaeota bacterium]HOR29532.1 hypothetical protein [Candidatus Sumerlaeota bacterium]HPK03866.1 hypothetical protein [Candidatus Sumerlaeota bacterium]